MDARLQGVHLGLSRVPPHEGARCQEESILGGKASADALRTAAAEAWKGPSSSSSRCARDEGVLLEPADPEHRDESDTPAMDSEMPSTVEDNPAPGGPGMTKRVRFSTKRPDTGELNAGGLKKMQTTTKKSRPFWTTTGTESEQPEKRARIPPDREGFAMMLGEDGGLETYTELNAVALDLHKPDPKKMVQRLGSLVNAAELRDLTSTVFKTYLVPSSENVAEAMAEAGRLYHDSAGAIKNKPEAERADAQEQLGPPFRVRVGSVPAQLGLDEGVGSRTRGSSETVLGEQRVEERTSAVGIARSVLQSEAVQESRGQGRVDAHCVLPGPDHPPLEGALEAALRLQKGVRKFGPAPRGPLEREAARLLTLMRGK